jgi:cytochrome c
VLKKGLTLLLFANLYFSYSFLTDKGRFAIKALTIAAAMAAMMCSLPVLASSELAMVKKCMECHGINDEVKGPSFKAIAKLYQGTDKAEAKMAEKIMKGGADHWGQNVMPSADVRGVKISKAESQKLARWVLTLK